MSRPRRSGLQCSARGARRGVWGSEYDGQVDVVLGVLDGAPLVTAKTAPGTIGSGCDWLAQNQIRLGSGLECWH